MVGAGHSLAAMVAPASFETTAALQPEAASQAPTILREPQSAGGDDVGGDLDHLAQALPFVSALRWAREEQARLLEMIAEDDAARHGDRLSVAGALIRLAGGAVPARPLR